MHVYQGFPTHSIAKLPFATVSFTLATSPWIKWPIFAIISYITCFLMSAMVGISLRNGYKIFASFGNLCIYRVHACSLHATATVMQLKLYWDGGTPYCGLALGRMLVNDLYLMTSKLCCTILLTYWGCGQVFHSLESQFGLTSLTRYD